MITYAVTVTKNVHDLVAALQEVEFGELIDVEIPESEDQPLVINVSRRTKELLDLIRDGVTFFKKIRVHQSEPTLAEVPGHTKAGGFQCIKQIHF